MLKGNCDGVMAAGIDAVLGGHVRNGSKQTFDRRKAMSPKADIPHPLPFHRVIAPRPDRNRSCCLLCLRLPILDPLKKIGHFFGPPLHKLATEYDGVVALYFDCAPPFEVM